MSQPQPSLPLPQPAAAPVPQTKAPDAPPPSLVPATALRRQGGRYDIAVQGLAIGTAENKSRAVSMLCRRAIDEKKSFVITFIDGQAKSYLAVSPRGEVTRAAAPAPGTALPDFSAPDGPRDLGTSLVSGDSTRQWVEETLLTGGEAARPRRRFFGRRK